MISAYLSHMIPLRTLARVGVVLLALHSSACESHERQTTLVHKSPPARLVAPTSLRKAQLPEEVTAVIAGSVHAELDCSDCHPAQPRPDGSVSVDSDFSEARCDHCHQDQTVDYASSVHARLEQSTGTRGAVCAQCHGDHDIYETGDPRSRASKRNVSSMCTTCHESPEVAARLRASAITAGAHYLDSIHGRALLEKGMVVAPSCVDCHGEAHRLRPAREAGSPVSEHIQPKTCGRCHEGLLEQYQSSIHAMVRAEGNQTAPTCATCHTAHDISATQAGKFRLASDELCGGCHASQRELYLDTFHGRAHDLGDTRVAACYDCHDSHAIRKVSDPTSTVSASNRLNTCRKCHENANPSFATFMPHADHRDAQRYPVLYWSFWTMTGLLLGTFVFFGVHTIFWFARSLVHATQTRESPHRPVAEGKPKLYLRFRPVDRFCHLLLMVSFLVLVATGMPLKFHSAPWAQAVFTWIGGVQIAGRLHRFGAMLTLVYFVIHLTSLVGPIRRRAPEFRDERGKFKLARFLRFAVGPDSPVPNLQDARDLVAHGKWFIGRGPRPSFDRFTYWEKFDYMAVFWGVTVIGLSGLLMWFPVAGSRLVPGWLINVAHVIHSDEALLAAGFIFTFHFFNSHFRPSKFPLDPVIFSGHMSEEEMKREHGRQFARLQTANQLEELVTQEGEWASWKWVLTPFGAIALLIGLGLAAAIFWALLSGR